MLKALRCGDAVDTSVLADALEKEEAEKAARKAAQEAILKEKERQKAEKAAAEKANINADMTSSEICDALVAVMTEVSIDGVTGAGITWSADGEPNKEPKGVIIEDGAYKAMD